MQTIFSAMTGAIDKSLGIIRGVSVITEGVARGHGMYADSTTLEQVRGLMAQFAEGTKVKVDHFSGFTGIIGTLHTPRIEGDKLRADFHLLSNHEMTPLIYEMAEKQPSTFGFSISFSGIPEEKDKLLYARVTELYSVDLVSDPAANPSGLFSVDSTTQPTGKTMFEQIKDFFSSFKEIERPYREEINQLNSQLAELTKLRTGWESEKTAFQAQITQLQKEVADAKESATKMASAKALEITAAQGQSPVATGTTATAASGTPDIIAQYETIREKEGPAAATLFYRKNKQAYDAAFDKLNQQQ